MKTQQIVFAGATLLLLVLYITSYTLDVRRGTGRFIGRFVGHFEEGQQFPISVSYRTGGKLAETIYSPMLFLDRRVRPEYWTITIDSNALGPGVTRATGFGNANPPAEP